MRNLSFDPASSNLNMSLNAVLLTGPEVTSLDAGQLL